MKRETNIEGYLGKKIIANENRLQALFDHRPKQVETKSQNSSPKKKLKSKSTKKRGARSRLMDYEKQQKPKKKKRRHKSDDPNHPKSKRRKRRRKKKHESPELTPRTKQLNSMLERFDESMRIRNDKIEEERREILYKELHECTHQPEINQRSKNMLKNVKSDFITRQKMYDEKEKKNQKILKEKLKKKQEDEMNKSSYLYKKKSMRFNKNNENDSHKRNKSVEQRIKKIYDWDQNRKKKLEESRKMQDEKIETKYNYKPKINHRSVYLVQFNKSRKKEPDPFKRLAKEDPVVTAKFEVLTEMYTPSFKPFLVKKSHEGSNENRYLPGNAVRYSSTAEKLNNEEKEEFEEMLEKKGDFEEEIETNMNQYSENEIQKAFRRAIIENSKKMPKKTPKIPQKKKVVKKEKSKKNKEVDNRKRYKKNKKNEEIEKNEAPEFDNNEEEKNEENNEEKNYEENNNEENNEKNDENENNFEENNYVEEKNEEINQNNEEEEKNEEMNQKSLLNTP